jgi:hypothetical protein
MARTKRWSTRGKSRVQQASTGHIERPSWGTSGELETIVLGAGDRCPLCVAMGVELGPSGHAEATVRAVVSPVQPDTV